MKRSRLIPFRFTPASWGLSGPAYDEAEIAYYYEGEDMERRLAKLKTGDATGYAKAVAAIDLKYEHVTKYQYDLRMLEIDGRDHDPRVRLDLEFTHGHIGEYEYGKKIIEIEATGTDRDVALLDHDLGNGKLTEREHAKAVATAKKEPWVGIVGDDFNVNLGTSGFSIELDWNDEWIVYLKYNGYTGATDDEIVDKWFSDVTREQTGHFAAMTDTPEGIAAHNRMFRT